MEPNPVDVNLTNVLIEAKHRPKRSVTIGKLGAALAKAQGEMLNAEKDVKGNYGKYATLAATWDAIRIPLSKNEISVYQRPLTIDGKATMCTMLIHSSGEFLDDGELELIFDRSGSRITPMQAMGSAVTYSRRYTLQAATGVAPADDDDGAGAGKPENDKKPQVEKKPTPPQPAKPNNMAPMSEDLNHEIIELAIDRSVLESELMYLATEGYGVTKGGVIPTWIGTEILKLLKNPETNSGTIMAEAVRVRNRREAAALAKGAK